MGSLHRCSAFFLSSFSSLLHLVFQLLLANGFSFWDETKSVSKKMQVSSPLYWWTFWSKWAMQPNKRNCWQWSYSSEVGRCSDTCAWLTFHVASAVSFKTHWKRQKHSRTGKENYHLKIPLSFGRKYPQLQSRSYWIRNHIIVPRLLFQKLLLFYYYFLLFGCTTWHVVS